MNINKISIVDAKAQTESDIGIFYNVDAAIKIIAPAPDGAEVGQHYFDESGSVLILRGIARLDDPDPVYNMGYQFSQHVYRDQPAATPEEFYAEQQEEIFDDEDYS